MIDSDYQITVKDLQRIIIDLESVNLTFDIEKMRFEQSTNIAEKNAAKKRMDECIKKRVDLLEAAGVADQICKGELR